jgi:hypothetical protein
MPFALGMVRKLAVGRLGSYFARAAFSRGGICCLTNTGPLAGWLDMDEVHPTPASPWLVQPFVKGETVCTYSTAHGGRVSSHLMYRIPRQRKHSTGIQFEAIDATRSLKLIKPIVAEHIGQMVVMAGDMNWDGEPIDGMSQDDATLLTSLRPQPGGSPCRP